VVELWVRLATKTINNMLQKLHRLYEQRKTEPAGTVDPGDYWRRWLSWAIGGLSQDKHCSINRHIDEITASSLPDPSALT
jgi:hypothetical protein